jgi:ribonuclease HI
VPWQYSTALLPEPNRLARDRAVWESSRLVPFRTFRLRGDKILVRVDEGGEPVATSDGRVDMIYRSGGKVYRAALRNLTPDADARLIPDAAAAPGEPAAPKGESEAATTAGGPKAGATRTGAGKSATAKPAQGARGRIVNGAVGPGEPAPADAIIAYTDGACSGNPGPMGVGVVLWDPLLKDRRERSEFLGVGTNNIAELVAIQRALELAPSERALIVHSDSSYALGLLALGWKAKANQALVAQLRELAAARPGLRLVKVEGHAGVPENERADELATSAVSRRGTTDTHVPKAR